MGGKTDIQQTNNTEQEASPVFLQSLRVENILSLCFNRPSLSFGPLNVLIGPNGAGKSNVIELIALLRSTATDMLETIRRGGGVQEWIWKGKPDAMAHLSVIIRYREELPPLQHGFMFTTQNQTFHLSRESISSLFDGPVFYYHFSEWEDGPLSDDTKSVLQQLRDPINHPEITYLATQYETIRLYREWQFGRNTIFRMPQRADMRTNRLEEDFSNLGLFLNRLRRDPKAKKAILDRLRDIYEGVDDFDVSVEGGTVQVFLTEGDFTIPATRLSDGTLRYLCLLAILCDPKPPPLICIEEPELGLHPDILPKIADLLIEASERTQLIVTTHSDILIDAMTERPEAVLVCEKHAGQTEIKRLSKDDLTLWLEKYRLGELWMRGEIGGTRWCAKWEMHPERETVTEERVEYQPADRAMYREL